MLNAFGIYAAQKPEKGPIESIGAEGYANANTLNFFKGEYYVRLQINPDGDDNRKILKKFALEIANRIPGKPELPSELSSFPRTGLVEGTFGFTPSGVLGVALLSNAYSAKYRSGSMTATTYLFPCETPESAKQLIENAKIALAKQALGEFESLSTATAAGFKGEHKYRGKFVVLQSGSKMVIALDKQAQMEWLLVICRWFMGDSDVHV
jgi:hypothetical protein